MFPTNRTMMAYLCRETSTRSVGLIADKRLPPNRKSARTRGVGAGLNVLQQGFQRMKRVVIGSIVLTIVDILGRVQF